MALFVVRTAVATPAGRDHVIRVYYYYYMSCLNAP